jgi:hypothetical protein
MSFIKESMYCEGNVNNPKDRNSGLQDVLEFDPVIILIILFSSWKILLLSAVPPQKAILYSITE